MTQPNVSQPAQPASQRSTQQPAPAAKSSRLAIPDLISIGIFTALYFVCVCVATLVSTLVAGAGTIFLPAVAALICGPVFMLSVARVGKFGGITVMGVVIGLFLFVSGHFALSFVASVVFPLAGDLIARIGNYRNRVTILIGYVVFCYGLTGPILPLWFMKDAYVASLEARGKSAAYINDLFSQISVGSFFVAMVAILVCGLIGGWFGQRILKKHFVKAGIA
ncbi:ABC transporter permease [Bifidobacterium ramosum]|uniref:ABC transporter permease n=1 Tax=Bifidobacterium ramosum TaxID=1798158 RepID=A0A6L4X130_9BIFI|nr:MptD family putative ECF transporter S component [Bifidobacterium ramosum]KAB8288328.1 ABC transporter permease [Bifidobacterium ramosum]NEG71635.1 MptD family putative ECF transporter S component [Bifidobacterium ramosum]